MDLQKLFQEEYNEAYQEFYNAQNIEREFDWDDYNSFEYGRIRGIEMLSNKFNIKLSIPEDNEEWRENEEEN